MRMETAKSGAIGWWPDTGFRLALIAAVPVWGVVWWLGGGTVPDPLWPLHEPGWFLRGVLFYPFVEEWLFRGVLQPWLCDRVPKQWAGITLANVLVSLLFASLHLVSHPPLAAMAVLVPSLVFGWLRDRHGSFLPAVAMHAWYNVGYFWVTSGMQRVS